MKNEKKLDELLIKAGRLQRIKKYDFSLLTTAELRELADENTPDDRVTEILKKGGLYEED